MTWSPISREHVESFIAAALERADDDVRQAWSKLAIPPEKWACSPWGDEGGGFWVVGRTDEEVFWFNDIEDGFNVSPYSVRGVIGEYLCNQSSFGEILRRLPEANQAEVFAQSKPALEIPLELHQPGRIGRRQTTYWHLSPADGPAYRAHFTRKQEANFVGAQYETLELREAHPVLVDYNEPWASLFTGGGIRAPDDIAASVRIAVERATHGWREADRYFAHGGPTRNVLASGGCLLKGPTSVVEATVSALKTRGVSASIVGGWTPRKAERVLLLGRSFIVADAFRFERVPG